jgi:hypothetical protein
MVGQKPDQSGSAIPGTAPFTATRREAERSTSLRHPAQEAT